MAYPSRYLPTIPDYLPIIPDIPDYNIEKYMQQWYNKPI